MGLLDKLLKKKQIKDKNEAGDESGEVRVAPKKEKTDEVVGD